MTSLPVPSEFSRRLNPEALQNRRQCCYHGRIENISLRQSVICRPHQVPSAHRAAGSPAPLRYFTAGSRRCDRSLKKIPLEGE